MKVEIEGIKFNFVFIKEKDIHNDGTEKINTICKIFESTGERMIQSSELEGIARLNYKDKYHKITGKKIALARALENHFWFTSSRRGFGADQSKIRRSKVWKAFNKYFRGEKNV